MKITEIASHTYTHTRTSTHKCARRRACKPDAFAGRMPEAFTFFNERHESHVSVMHSMGTIGWALIPSLYCIYPSISSIPAS